MKAFLVALQFLTILPVRIGAKIEDKDFGKSLAWFPVVGAIIGLLLSSSVFLFGFLPRPVIAALVVAVSVIITGGVHLDGFADTCDALYGAASRPRALEIMRDPHVGAMAVAGVAALLILKFALFTCISRDIIWKYFVLMAAFARWSQVLSCYLSKYARIEGKAKHFMEQVTLREFILSGLFTLALFILLLKMQGIVLFFATLLPIIAAIKYVQRRIGGMTGDTIGAISEASEVSVLLLGLIIWRASLC